MHARVSRVVHLAGLMLALLTSACAPTESLTKQVTPPVDLKAAARTLYDSYLAALREPRREAIAGFYHPDGAIRVINGVTARRTRAQLDSSYRGPWTPPTYFAWDSVAFDSIAPGQVLVTGGFRWMRAGQADTASWIYAAVLHATDSGLAIVFEHETPRPPR